MGKTEKKPVKKAPKKAGRIALKVADTTVDVASGAVSAVFKLIGTVFLILIITGMLFACVFAYYVKTCLTPTLDISLEEFKLEESSTIWYQDSSEQWHELVTLAGGQNRIWVDYDEIPEYMEKALVAIEDKRFYEHKGVDWYRTSGAFFKMFATMQDSYGGSTITQQLIKNLTGNDEVTVKRKLTEIFSALELEKKYDKQQIIEWYLNAVYFGEGCWGVQTAAKTYFNKDVSELSLAECAAIVGITNLPTYYDPFYNQTANKMRQETILREMYEQEYIDYETYKAACAEELVFAHSPNETGAQEIYTYYEEVIIDDVIADLMVQKGISDEVARKLLFTGGYQIYACIDPEIQTIVDNFYQNIENIPRTYNTNQQLQSAIVIMDPYTGEIVALCGGVGEKTQNFPLNRATGTYRSPGSSFKPIASYGPAVELGYITPATLVDDSPSIRLSGTSWYPANDGGGNFGVVTIYRALQYSLNTVAAQIIDKISPQVSYNFLTERLGVTSLLPADIDYAPMSLGQLTNGITVREMAQAYGALVNDGTFTHSRTYSLVTDNAGNIVIDNSPRTNYAFSANTAHVMTYMMQNAVETGTGGEAALRNMPVAGKTGTSGQYKDRWFVGCTPYYVAAVWTGYDQQERIYVSNGGNPAAQIFRKIMSPIHDGLPWANFPYPMLGGDTGIFNVVEEEEEEEEEDIILGDEGGNDDGNNYDDDIFDNNGNIDFGGGSGSNNGGYTPPEYNNGDDSSGDHVVFG